MEQNQLIKIFWISLKHKNIFKGYKSHPPQTTLYVSCYTSNPLQISYDTFIFYCLTDPNAWIGCTLTVISQGCPRDQTGGTKTTKHNSSKLVDFEEGQLVYM